MTSTGCARNAALRDLFGRGEGQRRLGLFQVAERDWDHAVAFQDGVGLRRLSPLADRRLIEFFLALPAEPYLREGQPRSFARRVPADRLPREVLANRRRGAQCPEWFSRLDARRGSLAETLSELEASPLARHCLDVPRLRRLFDAWPADAAAVQARWADYHTVFGRGLHVGQFLLAVEAGRL